MSDQKPTPVPPASPPLPLVVPPPQSPGPMLLIAVVAMALIGTAAVVLVSVFVPGQSAVIITTIVSMLVPSTTALLSLLKSDQNSRAIQDVRVVVDGRLTQLLFATETSARAAGADDERAAQAARDA